MKENLALDSVENFIKGALNERKKFHKDCLICRGDEVCYSQGRIDAYERVRIYIKELKAWSPLLNA